jgi:hypothetical protein
MGEGILNGGLWRRKITREDKAIPDDDVVALKIGQDFIS